MNEKVQLKHPQGKKPISMSKEKYNLLKPAVLIIGEVGSPILLFAAIDAAGATWTLLSLKK